MTKILVTGGNGQLGRALKKVLPKKDTVFADREDFDICDKQKTIDFISRAKPQIVIHAAAYTDVDGAQENKKLALQVNRDGAKNIALACKKIDAACIYISTDYVFDGKKSEPYTEIDKTNPLSIYGKSKLAGEKEIGKILKKYFIVRTAWLYGDGKNFIKTMLNLAQTEDEIKVVDDQLGSPTYALDLAKALAKICSISFLKSHVSYGIYHFVNSGFCSWYQFAKKAVELKSKKLSSKFIPITTKQWFEIKPQSSPKPKNTVLDNHKFQKTFNFPIRPWQKALADYIKIF